MNDLQPLIDQVEADTHSHVIVMMCDGGIRWRGETEKCLSAHGEHCWKRKGNDAGRLSDRPT